MYFCKGILTKAENLTLRVIPDLSWGDFGDFAGSCYRLLL